MGLGKALNWAFGGGGNDFQSQMSPVVAPMRQSGESDLDYQKRVYQQYNAQNKALAQGIQQAQSQNQINYGPADRYGSRLDVMGQRAARDSRNQNLLDFQSALASQGQQQGLINDVLAQSRGEGANPALAQLRLTTDQNIQNQAAMAASQRGINPALAARLAAQGGAATNQQAVGQAALQSAQQQIAAQQLGGQLLGQQIGQQVGMAQSQEAARVQQQQMAAALYAQQQQQLAAQAQAQTQAKYNREAMLRQQQMAYQQMIENAYQSANAVNAGVASQNANQSFQFGMAGMQGIMGGASKALGSFMNKGGNVENPFAKALARKRGYSEGGDVKYYPDAQTPVSKGGDAFNAMNPNEVIAKVQRDNYNRRFEKNRGYADGGNVMFKDFLQGMFEQKQSAIPGGGYGPVATTPQEFLRNQQAQASQPYQGNVDAMYGFSDLASKLAGKLKSNPNNAIISGTPSLTGLKDVNQGLGFGHPDLGAATMPPNVSPFGFGGVSLGHGGMVDGNPRVSGDSPKNDTVPAMLSPGEAVIPRTAMDDPGLAHAFLDELLKTRRPEYQDVVKARRSYEQMWGGGYC